MRLGRDEKNRRSGTGSGSGSGSEQYELWSDNGHGEYALHYLRNKEKQEIDFLVSRGKRRWLAVEAKQAAADPERHVWKFLGYLGLDFGLQIVAEPGVWRVHRRDDVRIIVASAAEALAYLA